MSLWGTSVQLAWTRQVLLQRASSLFAAEEGYLDDVDADKVTDFEAALHQYMESEQKELVDKINDTGDYSDEIKSGLHSALKEFKETHTW